MICCWYCVKCFYCSGSLGIGWLSYLYCTQPVIQKSWYIAFRHKNIKNFTIKYWRLSVVTESKYIGFVPTDDLSCSKDVEREKVILFKQFYSLFNKLFCTDWKVLTHLLKLSAMIFYDVETWFMKLLIKCLNNITTVYHKTIKCMCK